LARRNLAYAAAPGACIFPDHDAPEIDLSSIAAQRLANQRITRPEPRGPARVVAWLGAVQAQEVGPARWALGLRAPPGITDAAVARAVDQGRILRTHVLRPTWHFVAPADIRWMLELTGPRVQRNMVTYHRQLGLDARMLMRATALFERALGREGYLTRAELAAHLARAGLPASGVRLAHLVMHAELAGVICSGPYRGKQLTYALLAERAPRARSLPRDEALATLARRYFQSHGPATIRDFMWWSGLPSAEARRAAALAGARSSATEGLTSLSVGPPRAAGRRAAVHLLPIYDEFLVAYRDRAAVPHLGYPMGSFRHALVIAGQVAGTWRTAERAGRIAVDVTPARRLSAAERHGVAREVARYGRFIGRALD
jgi:hypothetical protein